METGSGKAFVFKVQGQSVSEDHIGNGSIREPFPIRSSHYDSLTTSIPQTVLGQGSWAPYKASVAN